MHHLGPARLSFILSAIKSHFPTLSSLENLTLLDVGCGGGLVCEPLARENIRVTGLDAGAQNITVASVHAQTQGLHIDYLCTTVEEYHPPALFDVVVALEIVEHVSDVPLFLKECARLLKPRGLMILSTLNRTKKSFALGIIAAEWILRWAPKGTHSWEQFIKPHELMAFLRPLGLIPHHIKGLEFSLLTQSWRLTNNVDVNYILCAKKG